MSDMHAAPETDAKRNVRVRLKLVTQILTNLGYGFVAVTIIQAASGAIAVTPYTYVGGLLGLFFWAAAVYIAPRGEPK